MTYLESQRAYPRPVSKPHQQLPPWYFHPAQASTASWPSGWGAWPDACERFAPTALECWKPPGTIKYKVILPTDQYGNIVNTDKNFALPWKSDQNTSRWRGQQHKAEDFQQGYPSPSAGWTSRWSNHRLDTAVSPGGVCPMWLCQLYNDECRQDISGKAPAVGPREQCTFWLCGEGLQWERYVAERQM